jgi:archaellum component FlaC
VCPGDTISSIYQAIKDVRDTQNALVDLFERLEFFFRRLEEYIEVRPTSAMKDIIVKIMVEVLSILGIVTKEIRQGQTSTYLTVDKSPQIYLSAVAFLKKRIGRKDVEEALRRLDHLTQEEARMAAAEVLTIACAIDDKVKAVDDKVTDVRDKVNDVDDKVEGVDKRVQSVDAKVEGINNHVQSLDNLVEILDSDVQSVGYKVGSVIQGKPYLRSYLAPILSLLFVRGEGDHAGSSTGGQSSHRPKLFVIVYPHYCRSRKFNLCCRERLTKGHSKMDLSPRSICQLQYRIWCPSRGNRSMVHQREHSR